MKFLSKEWLKHLVRLYLPVYQYKSENLKIAYAGYSSIKRNYFIRLLLEKGDHYTFTGHRWFWQVPRLIKSHNFDIVVSEISPFVMDHFRKYNGYIVPEWARMKINIDRPLVEFRRKSVSDFADVLRKIRKYNLTYELLQRDEDFEYFNDRCYIPYIRNRHGEEAWVEDLNIMWGSLPSPLLMVIREDGRIVGGSLIRISGDSLDLLRLGLLDGNEEFRRHGVIGALYYYGIVEGQKMGCKFLDVGGSRPFLADGLTRFKTGLGAQFVSHLSPNNSYLWFGINQNSTAATDFLERNPVMHISKDYSLSRSGT